VTAINDTDGAATSRRSRFAWLMDDPLLRPIREYGIAIIVTAGPWLVSIVALAMVSISMQPVLGRAAIEDLRLTVVYAFSLAPLVAAPIGIAAGRMVRQASEAGQGKDIAGIFLLAGALSGFITKGLAVLICLALGIQSSDVAISFVFLSVVASLLWTSFAVLNALQEYRLLILSFTLGMLFSLGCITLVGRYAPSVELLVWSFTSGFVFCTALVATRLGLLHQDTDDLARLLRSLLEEIWERRYLCLAVLLGIAGLWVDKWVLWFGPEGQASAAGFRHSIRYDGVMFVAHLSIIPSFAAMLVFHDGELARAIAEFRGLLHRRVSYRTLAANMREMNGVVWHGVLSITFVQATVTAALLLMAPLISLRMDFSFLQFEMLRVGLIAIFLYALFYLASAILILCGRNRQFFFVQAVFFAINLVASVVFQASSGITAYPIFMASLAGAITAFILAYRDLQAYDYHLFVGENAGLYRR
jgi:polysaccharide biosynthesis protein PelG